MKEKTQPLFDSWVAFKETMDKGGEKTMTIAELNGKTQEFVALMDSVTEEYKNYSRNTLSEFSKMR